MSARELEQARHEAAAARERLLGDVHELQARLRPRSIAGDVIDTVKERSEAAVDKATLFAAERPMAASAAALGAVALLLRRPIARLFRRKPKNHRLADHNGDME